MWVLPHRCTHHKPWVQYGCPLTPSPDGHDGHWKNGPRGNMSEDLKTQEAASCNWEGGKEGGRGGSDHHLFRMFYAKLSPSWLKTFLSTGNVLLHSVTPLSIYIYI